ncbi:MAG: universal stress protein [Verrucomicrobiaceae bacterium]|nr:universal stress protein [Verrucomicrobiaceae bacterium]
MTPLKNIVVGIDFSPVCDQALMEAERIAKWSDAELTATHVLDDGLVESLKAQESDLRSKITSGVESEVRSRIRTVLGSDPAAEAGFVIGDPFKELEKEIAHHSAELLVLGSGHDPGHIGAVASKCVRRGKCDVLLVREGQRLPLRKVVACVDFSETSRKAVETAFSFAKNNGATLELIYVFKPINEYVTEKFYFIPVSPKVFEDTDAIALDKVRKELATFVDPIAKEFSGVQSSKVILQSLDHKQAIIDYSKKHDADLVVLGKHGKAQSIVLGTTAERVVNHASCSVLVVSPA